MAKKIISLNVDLNKKLPQTGVTIDAFNKKFRDGEVFMIIHDECDMNTSETPFVADADAELSSNNNEGTQLYVKSTSTDDAAGGSGCTKVGVLKLYYDADHDHYHYGLEVVETNGTSAVALSSSDKPIRVLYFFPVSGTPAGTITLFEGSTTYNTIAAGALYGNGNKIYLPEGYTYFFLGNYGIFLTRTATSNGLLLRIRGYNVNDFDELTHTILISNYIDPKQPSPIPIGFTATGANFSSYVKYTGDMKGATEKVFLKLVSGISNIL